MDANVSDDGWLMSSLAEHWNSHGAAGGVEGRLSVPAREKGLKLVGKYDLGGKLAGDGRVADVSAKGNYAYLTMFYEPTCGRGGVQIVDIGNPAAPKAVSYIPSHVDTFSGEGSQVVSISTPAFKGDVLVYQNEWCPNTTNGVGGISLVDVSNPRAPKKLVEGAGDFTKKDGSPSNGVPQTKANETHSAFAWEQRDAAGKKTGRVYVVLVDDLEEPDVDILDISDPSKPKLVSETNLDQFAQDGPTRPHGDAVFSHDMVVKRIGNRDVMLMSYWDGGYITLDVSEPASPQPLSDTDFAPVDPARAAVRADDHAGGQRAPGRVHARQPVHLRHRRGLRRLPRRRALRRRPGGQPGVHRHPGRRHRPRQQGAAARRRHPLPRPGVRGRPGGRRRPDRGRRARRLRLPGQARQHRSGGLQGPDRLQPHGRRRLRDAREHARRVRDDPGDLRLAQGRLPPARRGARRLVHVQRGRHGHGDARRPVRAGEHRPPSSTAGATRTCTRPT